MNQQIAKKTAGFTIIELTLAMVFVSVLLLTIALTIIRVATIYNQGMTLKEVNQISRDINDELRRAVAGAPVFDVSASADTASYVTVKDNGGATMGGRLCLGSYSYIWNKGKALEDAKTNANVNKYVAHYGVGTSAVAVRFAKVLDAGKKYCARTDGALTAVNIDTADVAVAKELLAAGDHAIAMQSFAITTSPSADDPQNAQRLYSVTYAIGAGATSAMNTDQSACLPPSDLNSDIAYCTVQQFTITVRAGNKVVGNKVN